MHTNPLFPSRRVPKSCLPLAITIPEVTRENVAFRALIRQAILMLRRPEHYGAGARLQLAQSLSTALGLGPNDPTEPADDLIPPPTDADAPEDYEPGCDNGEDWP
jgi:hypothetical protein